MKCFEGLERLGERCPRLEARCAVEGDPPFALTVSLSGSLDDESGLAFLRAVEEALRACPGLCGMTLELSELRYASSTGVGAIAAIYMAAVAKNIRFSILNPSEQVEMVFGLLGFESFIPILRDSACGGPR